MSGKLELVEETVEIPNCDILATQMVEIIEEMAQVLWEMVEHDRERLTERD